MAWSKQADRRSAGRPKRLTRSLSDNKESMKKTRANPSPTVDNFRSDPLFPRIERVVAALLAKGKVVTPIDVLVGMSLIEPSNVDHWRRGRVPYLERVINCNLTRLGRLLRILRFHVHDLKLAPSLTVYKRFGKGQKSRLRFTKTGDPKIEEAYSRHFVWPGKGPFHPPASKVTVIAEGPP